MGIQDFYLGTPTEKRSDRFSIPLDGSHISIGPFHFRPRSIVLVNQTPANMIAEDDRGEQYIAAQSIGATYGTSDTMRFEVWLDAPQTSGKATVVVSEEAAGIAAAQLSSFAAAGGGGSIKRVALGSFPPASPADGDVISLAVATDVEWLLIFNAATNFWDFIGGPSLYDEVQTLQALPASAAYGDLATVGPAIALPRPGDYTVEHGFSHSAGGGVNQEAAMSYAIGGAGAADADRAYSAATGTTAPVGPSVGRSRLKQGLSAVTLTAKYRLFNAAHTASVEQRWMRVTPRRIQ